MGRNARKRISYVLPLAKSAEGHRLGVNGLAVDPANSILYSGGRDGVICAWDLHLDLKSRSTEEKDPFADSNAPNFKPPPTQFRQQVQAHTHWINDIALAHRNQALVSASSDITVKVWRPDAQDVLPPQTIGLHTDYVKRVASPGPHENWVASGGLDHKISLWDLNGGGQKLQIAVGEDENTAKGSVYALAASPSIIASGGPESIVRIWDSRTGKRITKFVGHTDNVRDVLITQDGDTILTASSDQTVKVWSMTAGRCMYTLTMHNDSVWSLFSDDPQLSIFYSADRSGIVAKSDVRNCTEWDEGVSVAVCQEHEGVNKVIAAGDYLWTATSSSSINRWNSVDTTSEVALPESYKWHRSSVATTRSRHPSSPIPNPPPTNGAAPKIPFKALLRMSNTAPFPQFAGKDADASTLYSITSTRKPSEVLAQSGNGAIIPWQDLPDFTIEGQNGLIKHHLLSDRRRVLTLDTAGEVILWDLIACVPIKSFGKRHLEDVEPEVNTKETVAHWCNVDTRTGSLTCVLEENYCFDAEMYADELKLEEKIDFRDDQRINLGKWILRYLFSNLIDEEIKRDAAFRESLIKEKAVATRPTSIEIPQSNINGWKDTLSGPISSSTIRPTNGFHLPATTPGLSIGLATPGIAPPSASHNTVLTPTTEEGAQLEKTQTQRSSTQDQPDYFSRAATNNGKPQGSTDESTDSAAENAPQSPAEDLPADKKKGKNLFSKKFGMNFNMKKFGTSSTATEAPKPAPPDEKAEDSDSRSSKTDEKTHEDNFLGVISKIRQSYEEQLVAGAQTVETQIAPSLPNETPVLKPPASTTILIQEDRPDAGGVADLFEGKVGSLGQQADLIEKCAPVWLADVLLRNQIPIKDIVKVSFILEPYQNQLPSISHDGYFPSFLPSLNQPRQQDSTTSLAAPYKVTTSLLYPLAEAATSPYSDHVEKVRSVANTPQSNNRLNANRMLRARKILGYVAERIEPAPTKEELEKMEREGEKPLKHEEYLELYCNNQLISPTMTLASIRAHVWRGGGDVVLYYKATGRKEIKSMPPLGGNLIPGSSGVSEGKPSSEAERSSQGSSGGILEGKAL